MLGLDGSALGPCVMADVSAGGARLLVKPTANVPNRFILLLSRDGELRRECFVAWRSVNKIGVRFDSRPLPRRNPKASWL
jgi:PilZ domain